MWVIMSLMFAITSMLLAGCSGQEIREGIYGGMYDVNHIEQTHHSTPAERVNRPDMDYNEYSRERKTRLEDEMP